MLDAYRPGQPGLLDGGVGAAAQSHGIRHRAHQRESDRRDREDRRDRQQPRRVVRAVVVTRW